MNHNSSDSPSHEKIAERAHQLWLERGQPEGRDQEHWLEAERQLRSQSGARRSSSAGGNTNGQQGGVRSDKRLDGLVQQPPGTARRTPKGEQL